MLLVIFSSMKNQVIFPADTEGNYLLKDLENKIAQE
jgi:hypothetical protein